MSHYNDSGVAYYRQELALDYGGLNDLELEWLRKQGATSPELNDAWDEFLELAGPFDSKSAWLSSLGYEGQVNDQMLAYWLA